MSKITETFQSSLGHFINPNRTDRGPLGPQTHSTQDILVDNEGFVTDFCEFVGKYVFYNISKTEISYLNGFSDFRRNVLGSQGTPEQKIAIFLI